MVDTCTVTWTARDFQFAVQAGTQLVFVPNKQLALVGYASVLYVPTRSVAVSNGSGAGSIALVPGNYVLHVITPDGTATARVAVPNQSTAEIGSCIDQVLTLPTLSDFQALAAEVDADRVAADASALAADTSADAAAASAIAASDSAAAADVSKLAAAGSATAAAGSATTASTQAGIATTQATSAATSAGTATTQATAASGSATSAAASATTATTQAGLATAAYDAFDDRYLGSKAADPTLDNDGAALLTGALYFNSSTTEMRVYTGAAWVATYVGGSFLPLAGGTLTGVLTVPAGAVGAPSVTISGDPDTGLWSPGANTLALATGGVERLRVDASGNVGIGTTAPASKLHVEGASAAQNLIASAGNGTFRMADSAAGATRKEFTITLDNTNNRVSIEAVQQGVSARNIVINPQGGNVGIGNTTPRGLLHVGTAASTTDIPVPAGNFAIVRGGLYNSPGTGGIQLSGGFGDAGRVAAWQVKAVGSGSGASFVNDLLFTTQNSFSGNETERMRIDASGNVGIGTSSPTYRLTVSGGIYADGDGGTSYWIGNNRAIRSVSGAGSVTYLDLGTVNIRDGNGAAAGAKLNVYGEGYIAGNLLVGTTVSDANVGSASGAGVAIGSGYFLASRSGDVLIQLNRQTTDGESVYFRRDGAVVGSISVTTTATSYNTSSDYRLKEDVQPVADAISRLNALNPVNFAWKADGSRTDGFIAHEVQAVVPQAVTGKKDAVNEDGTPIHQSIDHSKLVPLLTAALQEALAEITSLKSRLDAANL